MGRNYEYAEWLQFECEGVELSSDLEKLGEKFGERALEVVNTYLHAQFGPRPPVYNDEAMIWNTYASIVGHGVGLWEEDGDTGLPGELEGKLDVIVKKDKKLQKLASQIDMECHALKDAAGVEEKHAADFPSKDAAVRAAQSHGATHVALRPTHVFAFNPAATGYEKRELFFSHGKLHWPSASVHVKTLPVDAIPIEHALGRQAAETPRGEGPLEAGEREMVRFRFEDERQWHTTTLKQFRRYNPGLLEDEDIRVLRSGGRVNYGGGAQPFGFVEIVGGAREEAGSGIEFEFPSSDAAHFFFAQFHGRAKITHRIVKVFEEFEEARTLARLHGGTEVRDNPQGREPLQGEEGKGKALWTYMTDEQRTYVRRGFGTHDEPIVLRGVRIGDFAYSSQSLAKARTDVRRGAPSKTHAPVSIWHDSDKDVFFLIDGHHRLAEAMQRKEQTIDLEIVGSGYNDYYVTPAASETPQGGEPLQAEAMRAPPKAAVEFFRKHAGSSYNPKIETKAEGELRNARSLARAEMAMQARGWHVEWLPDPEPWDPGDTDYTPKEVFIAALKDETGAWRGSLGGIADPDRNYRRVVEAELADEAIYGEMRSRAQHGPHGRESPRVGEPLQAGEAREATPSSSEDAVPWVRITRDPEQYAEGMKRAKEIGPLDSGRQVYELLGPALSRENQEVFLVVLCNLRSECLGVAEVHRGERSRVSVSRADILQVVTKSGADHFMVVHNHPSGDPTPSEADRKLTKAIMSGADNVDVPCVDHVVIGMGKYYSFSQNKTLKV